MKVTVQYITVQRLIIKGDIYIDKLLGITDRMLLLNNLKATPTISQ